MILGRVLYSYNTMYVNDEDEYYIWTFEVLVLL